MRLTVKLPSLVDLKREGPVVVEVKEGITLADFLLYIESTDWGKQIIEDGRIRAPFGVIIDGELVMSKSHANLQLTSESKIRIIPLLSGG